MRRGEKKCLMPGCDNIAVHRGDCSSCYQKVLRRIKAGRITDAELVEAGHLLPTNRAADDPVDKAIGKIRKKQSA